MAKNSIKIGQESDVVAEGQVINEGADNTSSDAPAATESKKMSDAEVDLLAESLKDKIGLRIKTVPFNTVTWVDGTVVGVIADKRAHKALYAIKLDDGRRVVKSYDTELIQWTAEKIEIVKGSRSTSTAKKASAEELEKLEDEAAKFVGRTINYLPFKSEVKVEGIITSIVPDPRSGRILYKIESTIDGLKKICHKVSTSSDIEMTETIDEKMNEEFNKRRATRVSKANLTTEQKIAAAEATIKKIAENRKKLDDAEATVTAELAALKVQFEKEMTEATTESTEDVATASGDDLME